MKTRPEARLPAFAAAALVLLLTAGCSVDLESEHIATLADATVPMTPEHGGHDGGGGHAD